MICPARRGEVCDEFDTYVDGGVLLLCRPAWLTPVLRAYDYLIRPIYWGNPSAMFWLVRWEERLYARLFDRFYREVLVDANPR